MVRDMPWLHHRVYKGPEHRPATFGTLSVQESVFGYIGKIDKAPMLGKRVNGAGCAHLDGTGSYPGSRTQSTSAQGEGPPGLSPGLPTREDSAIYRGIILKHMGINHITVVRTAGVSKERPSHTQRRIAIPRSSRFQRTC